jgi:hypothetical protein
MDESGYERDERTAAAADVWRRLAAPLDPKAIAWRQDGRPIARDGKYFARFVASLDAGSVRERLDAVVPGGWSLTMEMLPPPGGHDESSDVSPFAFKARLEILHVVREDVGTGKDYRVASSDAFTRAAVRFGVGNELAAFEPTWVPMDGDGKYAKPLEDARAVYERRGRRETASLPFTRTPDSADVPSCPRCGGRMWDNRLGKRNPRAPDFKCRDRSCDGVVWPARADVTGRSA